MSTMSTCAMASANPRGFTCFLEVISARDTGVSVDMKTGEACPEFILFYLNIFWPPRDPVCWTTFLEIGKLSRRATLDFGVAWANGEPDLHRSEAVKRTNRAVANFL